MSAFSRPVLLLLSGLLLLTISMAVLNTLVPLWLAHEHFSTLQIGIVGSSYFMGNLLGTLIAGSMITRWGFNRSYQLACLVFAIATAGLALSFDFISWASWRLLAGVACAVIWVVVESALLRSGTMTTRGLLLAAYMTIYYLGMVFGQLLLSVVPTLLNSVLPWAITLLLVAILPLLFTRFARPLIENNSHNLWSMLKRRDARLGINGCIISGVVLGSLYGLLPLYLSHHGFNDANVAFWMALLVSSGIVGQIPVGRLADRYGRVMVLRIQVVLVIMACVMILGDYSLMGPALFILGCSGFTLYPVAMAWACEKAKSDELVAMNQALLLSYTVGSLAGPTLTALLMQQYSDSLLFVVIASAATLFLMMLFKRTDRHHQPLPI